ncbi:MAG: hypothetical protein ACP5TL_00480 [Candidatus Micrarchaeia archaeon]
MQENLNMFITIATAVLITTGFVVVLMSQHILVLNPGKTAEGYSSIDAIIHASGFIVSNLKVSISGNNTNASVPLNIVSRCFVQGIPKPMEGSLPRINITIQPCNLTESVVFTNLKPFSLYNVSIFGSESPYCIPGSICPMFILRVSKTLTVRTGAAGTVSNASFYV